MVKYLVGYTGFVGSNIAAKASFDGLFVSKNIQNAYNKKPDLLVYSGIRGTKFLANTNPEEDLKHIQEGIENIQKIAPKKLVLISTVDVFKEPNNVDEDSKIDLCGLHAYGTHRYELEQWVEKNVEDYTIIRLPAIYGLNLKKNFIFDLINSIPPMLSEKKYAELIQGHPALSLYYKKEKDSFFHCKPLTKQEDAELKDYFNGIGFTALNFTDSRAKYQFYNLSFLWGHIEIAVNNGIKLLNITTEPISAAELHLYIKKQDFTNIISDNPIFYDYRTKYSSLFGGRNGYIQDKPFLLEDIKQFIESYS